jgi:cytosine permease
LPFLPLPPEVLPYTQPAALYGFIAGFVVYVVLAKAGLEPKRVTGFPVGEVVNRKSPATV